MLQRWLNRSTRKQVAGAVFDGLNQAARDPALFADGLLADDPDGRFEAMALMSAVLFDRLSTGDPALAELSQDVFDRVFKSFDQALRVLGVGDLHVGKRIRKMAESYYGRMHAYRQTLGATTPEALASAIARNCFLSDTVVAGRDDVVAAIAFRFQSRLQSLSDADLLSGSL